MTVSQAVALLLSAAVIAILFERLFPRWDSLSPERKKAVLAAANTVASIVLTLFGQFAPGDVQSMTVTAALQAVAMLAISFIVHLLDVLATAKATKAKADASLAAAAADTHAG